MFLLRSVRSSSHEPPLLVTLKAEQISACADILHIKLSAKNLTNKDGFFGKSDPFFSINRSREDGTWLPVMKSPVVMDNLNPHWAQVQIPVQEVCNNDYSRPLQVEVWDWDADGGHDLIGAFQCDLNSLQANQVSRDSFLVVDETMKKKQGGKYKGSGQVFVEFFSIEKKYVKYEMLHYIQTGVEISFVPCIDYTASNGAPSSPSSLHYMVPNSIFANYNEYQKVGCQDLNLHTFAFSARSHVSSILFCFLSIPSSTNIGNHDDRPNRGTIRL
jgi:hypothetical protein